MAGRCKFRGDRLDGHHRRPVDCLESIDFNPKPVARHDAGTVQADRLGRLGEQVLNTPVSDWLMSSSKYWKQQLAHIG